VAEVIECEGAPRDLGFDQGTRCRRALRAAYRSEPRWRRARIRLLAGSDADRRMRRELRRFHPQQAETLEAMARAARVPLAWLVAQLAESASASSRADAILLAAASPIAARGGLLARSLPADAIVRRSRPDAGFRSVELIRAWGVAPLAGVNEAGLAVACLARPAGAASARQVAPVALLAHDCLRRFDRLEGAVDWLSVRPGGGKSILVLTDATGEIAGVSADGDERRVLRPADGLILDTRGDARRLAIEKDLREASPLSGADLGRFFGTPLLAVEVERRRIGLLGAHSGGGADRWFEA